MMHNSVLTFSSGLEIYFSNTSTHLMSCLFQVVTKYQYMSRKNSHFCIILRQDSEKVGDFLGTWNREN